MPSCSSKKIVLLAKRKAMKKDRQALDTIKSLKELGEKTFYSVAEETGLSKTSFVGTIWYAKR